VHDTYEGKADASFKGGHAAGQLDPVVMAAAMTAVTKSVSVGITGSTTYIPVSPTIHSEVSSQLAQILAILACTDLRDIRSYEQRSGSLEYCYEL
jgi:hypothetical protein